MYIKSQCLKLFLGRYLLSAIIILVYGFSFGLVSWYLLSAPIPRMNEGRYLLSAIIIFAHIG